MANRCTIRNGSNRHASSESAETAPSQPELRIDLFEKISVKIDQGIATYSPAAMPE